VILGNLEPHFATFSAAFAQIDANFRVLVSKNRNYPDKHSGSSLNRLNIWPVPRTANTYIWHDFLLAPS
jgi:hypothetical protein